MCVAVSVVVLLLLCVLLCGVVPVQPQRCPPTASAATVAATGTGTGTRHVQIPTYLFEADMKQDAAHPARLPACPPGQTGLASERGANLISPVAATCSAAQKKQTNQKIKKRQR